MDIAVSPIYPEFVPATGPAPARCTPHELFRRLVESPEEHLEYIRPAFHFALDAIDRALAADAANVGVNPDALDNPAHAVDALIADVGRNVSPVVPGEIEPARAVWIAHEFAPLGLTDGGWLVGSLMANAIESEVGMCLLSQFMTAFGDPGGDDSAPRKYEALLRSLGEVPQGVIDACSEWRACLDISYEHALLGLCLGRFPSAFGFEILGFNLWMTTLGPSPLMARLQDCLGRLGVCLSYFTDPDRQRLAELAKRAVIHAVHGPHASAAWQRVRRGFLAAHGSHERWARAMCDPKSPGLSVGVYMAPDDPSALEQFALERYAKLPNAALYHRFANTDRYPTVAAFGRRFVTRALARLSHALDSDERLNSMHPPAYSERAVAEMVAAYHAKNVASRRPREQPLTAPGADPPADEDDKYIGALFDGCWLQGFADVRRTGFEEYGWLFRIYASEHGDGDLAWNHSRIFNLAFAERGLNVPWPKTDERLYSLFDVAVGSVAKIAISLDTRHFMPEILGMNLGIEASGVGGSFMDTWKTAERKQRKWQALAARLHNSIDNYADGHTKWSLSAVQAYMRRVKDAAPDEVAHVWHRLWRLWRVQEILAHGSQVERDALAEHLDLRSLVPA
jgi:hypothetical protein